MCPYLRFSSPYISICQFALPVLLYFDVFSSVHTRINTSYTHGAILLLHILFQGANLSSPIRDSPSTSPRVLASSKSPTEGAAPSVIKNENISGGSSLSSLAEKLNARGENKRVTPAGAVQENNGGGARVKTKTVSPSSCLDNSSKSGS